MKIQLCTPVDGVGTKIQLCAASTKIQLGCPVCPTDCSACAAAYSLFLDGLGVAENHPNDASVANGKTIVLSRDAPAWAYKCAWGGVYYWDIGGVPYAVSATLGCVAGQWVISGRISHAVAGYPPSIVTDGEYWLKLPLPLTPCPDGDYVTDNPSGGTATGVVS